MVKLFLRMSRQLTKVWNRDLVWHKLHICEIVFIQGCPHVCKKAIEQLWIEIFIQIFLSATTVVCTFTLWSASRYSARPSHFLQIFSSPGMIIQRHGISCIDIQMICSSICFFFFFFFQPYNHNCLVCNMC